MDANSFGHWAAQTQLENYCTSESWRTFYLGLPAAARPSFMFAVKSALRTAFKMGGVAAVFGPAGRKYTPLNFHGAPLLSAALSFRALACSFSDVMHIGAVC